MINDLSISESEMSWKFTTADTVPSFFVFSLCCLSTDINLRKIDSSGYFILDRNLHHRQALNSVEIYIVDRHLILHVMKEV
jgi:hypothetical protein